MQPEVAVEFLPMVEDSKYSAFAERLNQAMAEAGLDVNALKTRIGVTYEMARRYTMGAAMPRAARLEALALALNKSASWLAFGEGKAAADSDDAPSDAEYVLIPQYTAKGECGVGYYNDHVEVRGGLAFKRDWLRRMGLRAEKASVIYAQGNSMAPTIHDGEVVLLDESQHELKDNQVFALMRDDELLIKRTIKDWDGSWIIKSDNPDKAQYPDIKIDAATAARVSICGRVVWRGGGL